MVDVIIRKTQGLSGTICAPPSKSYTQRMLIASALATGTSKLSNPLLSEDTEATLRAIKALGAKVVSSENCWIVTGEKPLTNAKQPIDCGESGATFRFMIPIAALAAGSSTLMFRGSLERRPIEPLIESLKKLGGKTHIAQVNNIDAVFVEGGGITGGKTSIPGDISSQFISGLMLACPMAKKKTEIIIETPLESADYVKMTKDVLSKYHIQVDLSEDFESIQIPNNQIYEPCDCKVPGDFSSAAFLLAAAALTNSKVKINNLDYRSVQGDKRILGILKQMSVNGTVCEDSVEINGTGGSLEPLKIDAKNIPDLVPVCAALACYANGTSQIVGARRLRLKESDRLSSLYFELQKMGVDIIMDSNGLTIKGGGVLHGAVVDPHNDHRIAMACSVAALGAQGETTILNAECVRKSYPKFFTHLREIGADIVGGKFDW